MIFEEARKVLATIGKDDENYHRTFDLLIEERLMELDPEFMGRMKRLYQRSGNARWCA